MSEGISATLPRPPTMPHVNGAVKEPIPPPFTPPKEARPTIPVTEAHGLKMDKFNRGESGRDVAVPFHLKAGEQGFSFALMIDPKDDMEKQRIINLPDTRDAFKLPKDAQAQIAILQQKGDKLSVRFRDREEVLKGVDADNPKKLWFNVGTGFEILGFDPATHVITIHKIKNQPVVAPPVSPVPEPTPTPKPIEKSPFQRFVDIVPPIAVGLSTVGIPQDKPPVIIEEMPGGMPSAQPIENFLRPTPIVETETSKVEEEAPIVDESLKCPATKEFTIKEGQSLTRALIEVNGLGRYLNEEGKLDVDGLYKDLACLLVQPENFSEIESSDPKVAAFIKSVTGDQVATLVGPLSADLIYGGLKVLNEDDPARKAYSNQLVIVHPGQKIQVPDFTSQTAQAA